MAAIAIESQSPGGIYPESPNDIEDVVYPCKGCGEILEEGKAFELAGNRWHIDCFRCNTCGTLLDSDANLLLLGDGSLICNNCTYSCNACGNKIEDLAILTGDQAFCAACFRCRNCKRKIENLRYARTSQGIFCMSCHESLMARRRKKAKSAPRQAHGGANGASAAEKALPSLPPSAFPPETETPPSEMFAEVQDPRASRQQHLTSKKGVSSGDLRRGASPVSEEAQRDGPILPASTYNERRPSNVSEDTEDGDERGLLPMAFDPTPVPAPPPAIARKQVPRAQDLSPLEAENRPPKDYFNGRLSARAAQRDGMREGGRPVSIARSVSTERETLRAVSQPRSSPHILFQEKGRHRRQASDGTPLSSTPATPSSATMLFPEARSERPKPQHLDTGSFTLGQKEGFKLQEVPQSRRVGSRSRERGNAKTPVLVSPVDTVPKDVRTQRSRGVSPVSMDSPESDVNPFDDPRRKENMAPSPVPLPPRHVDRPARGDSLAASTLKSRITTPDLSTPSTVSSPSIASTPLASGRDRENSESTAPTSFVDAQSAISHLSSGAYSRSGEPTPVRGSFDAPPPRNSSRMTAPSKSVANGDFIAPRAPPPPPPIPRHHRNHESISTMQSFDMQSDGQLSPGFRSTGVSKGGNDGGFSMEDEMSRILTGERRESQQTAEGAQASVLRRVSNAVKHGRSFSDRGLSSAGKSQNGSRSVEISSPMTIGSPLISSPNSMEPMEQLRSVNRRANQRMAELEAENLALREQLDSSAEIKSAAIELRQKRETIVVLDAQREMVVAELESMTAHLKRAKDSNQPLDLNVLKTDILKDFADSLQKLKDQLSTQIEDLMHRRNELTEEIGTLIQMKDKGFQEYENLSGRNNQLIDMNNQLVHGMQETYKANRAPNGLNSIAMNGLGIYHPGAKPETPGPSEFRNLNLVSTDSSMPNLLQEIEAEPATVLTAPQVVNIRKGQPKKFNWRKGGEKMAKNVTKGLKGAFVGDRPPERREIGTPYTEIGVPYSTTHQGSTSSDQGSLHSKQTTLVDGKPGAAGFGFFGQKSGGLKPGAMGSMKNSSSTNLSASADPSVLFGSELEARCDYEKRVVPSVVSRCIQEVEARGMNVEGVYRKSGGSGQVKTVQMGFEKAGDYDISDPDLDIHAVTSALKQYFRKLPTPLITYDVYDSLLEAGQTPDKERQAYNLRMAINELPESHRNCLEMLIEHLARVMSHESENLMTPLNLAVVFAPTIMRPLSIEREMSDMQVQRMALQAMLEQHAAIFGEEDD